MAERDLDKEYVERSLYHTFIDCQREDGRPTIDGFTRALTRYGCVVVPVYALDELRRRVYDLENPPKIIAKFPDGCNCQ